MFHLSSSTRDTSNFRRFCKCFKNVLVINLPLEICTPLNVFVFMTAPLANYHFTFFSELICPFPTGYYHHPCDCSKFFVCANGNPAENSCQDGLLYDAVTKKCDYANNVDCDRSNLPAPDAPEPLPASTVVPDIPEEPGCGTYWFYCKISCLY